MFPFSVLIKATRDLLWAWRLGRPGRENATPGFLPGLPPRQRVLTPQGVLSVSSFQRRLVL